MTRLAILEVPDPRLRQPSAPVATFDASLVRLVDDLVETLHDAGGIGLAAPQTGHLTRVLVMDLTGDRSGPEAYVNPSILARSAFGLVEESCLSLPGVVANVVRATRVKVRAQDATGAVFERDLEGMHAVCLQHEVDHLDGKLFVDRLSAVRRMVLRLRGKLPAAALAA
jgi:peptide deformylase